MATIAQKALFEWNEVEDIGDLIRLRFAVDNLPDEPLMYALEKNRGKGRDDYPIRAIWNSVIAGVVFSHETVESLRRELKRNGQLREICGFDVLKGSAAVPGAHVYSRFLYTLIDHRHIIAQMFERMVNEYGRLHRDFGKVLAVDGKAISSFAKRERKNKSEDRRAEHDARWGKHEYSGIDERGNPWKQVKRWFGFKLHVVVDAVHELPVAFELSDAATNEMPVANLLVDSVAEAYPWLAERCDYLCADRGDDDGKLIKKAWDEYEIKPVIDIRNCWKDGDDTKVVPGQENVVYDFAGTVTCVCPRRGKRRHMPYGGFEKERNTLKYRCPVWHYGSSCEGREDCKINRSIRIPLSVDRRVFTPVPRSSYKWQRIYEKRTAVERVFSRLDTSFGFEHHTIRGFSKMHLKVSIALCVMLAMAIGWTKANRPEMVRSLLKAG